MNKNLMTNNAICDYTEIFSQKEVSNTNFFSINTYFQILLMKLNEAEFV